MKSGDSRFALSLSQLEVWSFLRRLFSALRMEFHDGENEL